MRRCRAMGDVWGKRSNDGSMADQVLTIAPLLSSMDFKTNPYARPSLLFMSKPLSIRVNQSSRSTKFAVSRAGGYSGGYSIVAGGRGIRHMGHIATGTSRRRTTHEYKKGWERWVSFSLANALTGFQRWMATMRIDNGDEGKGWPRKRLLKNEPSAPKLGDLATWSNDTISCVLDINKISITTFR